MRAGQLDRVITIQRATNTVNAYGTPVSTWTDVATVRAQKVQASTEEYIRGAGASDETVIVFRTRYLAGVTNADRIVFDGFIHEIKETKELGRGDGLELRTWSYGKLHDARSEAHHEDRQRCDQSQYVRAGMAVERREGGMAPRFSNPA